MEYAAFNWGFHWNHTTFQVCDKALPVRRDSNFTGLTVKDDSLSVPA
jgi:hypothetical protein